MALASTLAALESGLRVRDITTMRMRTCRPTERVARVLARADLRDFDQIPVTRERHVIGVLERTEGLDGEARVEAQMRRLDDALLVEAELPLPRFLPLALQSPYYLVVTGAKIGGLVTRSDLLKMPVRLLAFAHVAHLETQMARYISRRASQEEWLALLDDGGKRTMGMARRLARDRLDPNLIELTLFSEKRQVVSHLLDLSEAQALELFRIENMRNAVAHGTEYGKTNEELTSFVAAVADVGKWLRRLETGRDVQAVNVSTEDRLA